MESYYELLGANSSMSIKDIKKEYIKLMKKNHPDRSGQDDQCKKITEAYQKIAQYKLNLNNNEKTLIPLEYTKFDNTTLDNTTFDNTTLDNTTFDNTTLDMDYVHEKIKLSNKNLEVILELKDIKRKAKSVFEKVFDFFFDLDSDDSDDSGGD